MTTLRWILKDQLSESISSLKNIQTNDVIFMCETHEMFTDVKHHKKKIALTISAMRHFANALKQAGHQVHYLKLEDPKNTQSNEEALKQVIERYKVTQLIITAPSEYPTEQTLKSIAQSHRISMQMPEDDRFLSDRKDFRTWAKGRKQLRMEYFYRNMRQQYKLLMAGDSPEGGQWNYDHENRKKPDPSLTLPNPHQVKPDTITQQAISLTEKHFSDHFGDLQPFTYAVTRTQALEALELFIAERLPHFGDFQDAMLQDAPWMYHALLSPYINLGLLLPLECAQRAEAAYRKGTAPLNAVEGFIRQIIGWREYIRGIYWMHMPDYAQHNHLKAKRKLPKFYWTGETTMNCMQQCVQTTQKYAYAHHIQRLMVLGNFALLAGIDPKEVNEWFWIVYADAYEWVELPNVTGMALYADGGMMSSKPYAASGQYIHKMSNYCEHCTYNVKAKTGPEACPFNHLYWHFIARHEKELRKNPRMRMIYASYDKMSDEKKTALKKASTSFLRCLH